MKKEFIWLNAGLSVVGIVLWMILPVFSFVFVVPIFGLTGWRIAYSFNQLMFFPIAFTLFMAIAALTGKRQLMQVAAILEVIVCILIVIFKKDILLTGNLNWLYTASKILVDSIGSLAGVAITQENFNLVLDTVAVNFLQPGLGFVIHGLCVLAYLIISFIAPEEKKYGYSSGRSSTQSSTPSAPRKTGYNHRT